MPPVMIKNRMRTRSASRMDAPPTKKAFSSADITKKSTDGRPGDRCTRRQPMIDEGFVMSKEDLARSIAEFRVGLPPLWSSPKSSFGGSSGKMDNMDNADQNFETDDSTPPSLSSPSPLSASGKDESHDLPKDPSQTTTTTITTNIIPSPHEPQTERSDDATGSASSEDSTSQHPSAVSSRRGFTASERELLEAAFHISENPGSATMKLLVHLTGLGKKKIRGWFRTRRLRQEREASERTESSSANENETSSTTEPTFPVPPQYWPEPLRLSHMQPSYPVPGHHYRAPPGLFGMAPGVPGVAPGVPSIPRKAPRDSWYPPPPVTVGAPPMGFLPPHNPLYPALGCNPGLPAPSGVKDGEASLSSPPAPTVAPTGHWCPPYGVGHPLQGATSQSSPMANTPGFLPGRPIHPWSPLCSFGAPATAPMHPGLPPHPLNPAMPFFNPWCHTLPAPINPALHQNGSKDPILNTTSLGQNVKPVSGNDTSQDVSEGELEAPSTD